MNQLNHEDYYRGWVLGFLFSEDLRRVVLIQKTHPNWWPGKLNGISGKIPPGSSHRATIWNKSKEELGYDYDNWQYLKSFSTNKPNHNVHVFYGVGDISKCITMNTNEPLFFSSIEIIRRCWFANSPLGVVAGLIEECIESLENILVPTTDIKYKNITMEQK